MNPTNQETMERYGCENFWITIKVDIWLCI